MNPAKLIISFIILTIQLKFPTLAFNNAYDIFPTVDLKKLPNHPIHCSCHKNELLSEMAAVEFKNGNKYLISTEPIGEGGTALVFHAIYIGKKWKMSADAPTNCVAIKVANPSKLGSKELIKKEMAILNNIFHPTLPTPSHNWIFLRSEVFEAFLFNRKSEYFAIVMELGEQNLYEYWQKAMIQFCVRRFNENVSETMLLYIMREISLGLDQLHQRNYIFIDLKPQNVMIMPESPNPKELQEENLESLQIKLTDFGSAIKFVPEIGKRTLSQNEKKNLMGSFFYWAPELYSPFIDEISPGTDIFSLGRLMLILAIQTPQMKIFMPQIKNFWKEWNMDGNSEESHKNWVLLVGNMLLAANIPPKPKISPSSSASFRSGTDHEIEIGMGSENESEIEQNLKKLYDELKWKGNENENKENLKIIYDGLKKNYGHLMEIIERTQAAEQKQRPTALAIVADCTPKLAHLERNQATELKSAHQYTKSDSLIMRSPKSPLVDKRNRFEIEKKSAQESFKSDTLVIRTPQADMASGSSNITPRRSFENGKKGKGKAKRIHHLSLDSADFNFE